MSLRLLWVGVVAATSVVGGLTACGTDIASMSAAKFVSERQPAHTPKHIPTSTSTASPSPTSTSTPTVTYTFTHTPKPTTTVTHTPKPTATVTPTVTPAPTATYTPPSTHQSRSQSSRCSNGTCTVVVSGAPTQVITLGANNVKARLVISDFTDDSISIALGTEKKSVRRGTSVVIGDWTITLQSVSQNGYKATIVAVAKSSRNGG